MALNISELSDLHPKQRLKGFVYGIGLAIISYYFLYDKNANEKWIKKNEDIKRYNEKKIDGIDKNGIQNNKILDYIKKNNC